MTRSRSLAQAEKMALEGSNGSQDSQAIFDAHQARFGIGTVRTSYPLCVTSSLSRLLTNEPVRGTTAQQLSAPCAAKSGELRP